MKNKSKKYRIPRIHERSIKTLDLDKREKWHASANHVCIYQIFWVKGSNRMELTSRYIDSDKQILT